MGLQVNQLGYIDNKDKILVSTESGNFKVKEKLTGKVIFEGISQDGLELDLASGDRTNFIDLSVINRKGKYVVESAGVESFSFQIGSNPYRELKNALLKGIYYQRCGCELHNVHAGSWKHKVCHTGKARLYENPNITIDITGGWHDAGDYGRYVVPAAVTIAMLLLTYEHSPKAFGDELGIPESGNGIADILDEVRWKLEWLFKMQREDGGVYHKATTASFPGMIMPEDDHDYMIISPVSATATGDFAAALAMASRIYKELDKEFSDKLLAAAKKAWQWLESNPEGKGFKNPEGILSGEYGDDDVRDERLWAAAALYRATGDNTFAEQIENMLNEWKDIDTIGLGWAQVGGFAALDIIFMENAKKNLVDRFKGDFIREAQRLKTIAEKDGYKVPMLPEDYVWGSTMVLLNRGVHLILVSKLTGDKSYENIAMDCLHWLLGRNPLGVCYVTGYGSAPIKYPHHRPSEADGVDEAVPGLVSGGPDKNLSDDTVKQYVHADVSPAKAFIDNAGSYATNEITTYWNSPAIFVVAWFDK